MSTYHVPKSIVLSSRKEHKDTELSIQICAPHAPLQGNEGQLPDDLQGFVFVVAPLRHDNEQEHIENLTHIINGDGMIYRLGFEQGTAKLKSRIAKTPCYYADIVTENLSKSDKKEYAAYKKHLFKNGGITRLSSQLPGVSLGARNQLNTAFLKTKSRLFATFDAGRPYAIDPDSLELLEPLGSTNEWIGMFPTSLSLSFLWRPLFKYVFQTYSNSAHPAWDLEQPQSASTKLEITEPSEPSEPSEEVIFTVNYSRGFRIFNGLNRLKKYAETLQNRIKQRIKKFLNHKQKQELDDRQEQRRKKNRTRSFSSFTDLIRHKAGEPLERWQLFLPNDEPVFIEQSVHQLALTEQYIILADLSFRLEVSQILFPIVFGIVRGIRKSSKQQFIRNMRNWIAPIFLRLIKPLPFTSLYVVDRSVLKDKPGARFDGRDKKAGEQIPQLPAIKLTLPHSISHFAVDYLNPEGNIILHAGHNNGWDYTEWISLYDRPIPNEPKNRLRQDLNGMIVGPMDVGALAHYVFDGKTGALLDSKLVSEPGYLKSDPAHFTDPAAMTEPNTWALSVFTHRDFHPEDEASKRVKDVYWMSWGFSWELIPERIYEAYKRESRFFHEYDYRGIPYQEIPDWDQPVTLLHLNTETMKIQDWYTFPSGYFACSPQFVPSSDPNQAGYIVCIVFADDPTRHKNPKDEFWIFHADGLRNKPIYRLSGSNGSVLNFGLSLHTTWLSPEEMNRMQCKDESERQRQRSKSFEQDYQQLIADVSRHHPELQSLFQDWVQEHFIQQTSEEELLEALLKATSS